MLSLVEIWNQAANNHRKKHLSCNPTSLQRNINHSSHSINGNDFESLLRCLNTDKKR